MQRQVRLCARCAGVISEKWLLRRLTEGPSGSVRCEFCGRMRIGSDYAVEREKKREAGK